MQGTPINYHHLFFLPCWHFLSVPCGWLFTMLFVVPGTVGIHSNVFSFSVQCVGPLENEIRSSISLLSPSPLRVKHRT